MTDYNMHYIGKGLYDIPQFEAEAEEHGVARALPARMIRALKWGDEILLAQWQPDPVRTQKWQQTVFPVEGGFFDPETGTTKHYKRYGSALVFGYFTVHGLNMNAPKEAKEELAKRLRVESVQTPYGPGGFTVVRRCGNCTIGATYWVEDTIEEIMDKAAEVEKAMGVKFRWFATGIYHRLEPQVTLDPAKFTRGILKVEVDGDFPDEADGVSSSEHSVNFILDYVRKTYIPKEAKE